MTFTCRSRGQHTLIYLFHIRERGLCSYGGNNLCRRNRLSMSRPADGGGERESAAGRRLGVSSGGHTRPLHRGRRKHRGGRPWPHGHASDGLRGRHRERWFIDLHGRAALKRSEWALLVMMNVVTYPHVDVRLGNGWRLRHAHQAVLIVHRPLASLHWVTRS